MSHSRKELPNEVTEEDALELYKNNDINKAELVLLLVEIANKKSNKNHVDMNSSKKQNKVNKKRTFK